MNRPLRVLDLSDSPGEAASDEERRAGLLEQLQSLVADLTLVRLEQLVDRLRNLQPVFFNSFPRYVQANQVPHDATRITYNGPNWRLACPLGADGVPAAYDSRDFGDVFARAIAVSSRRPGCRDIYLYVASGYLVIPGACIPSGSLEPISEEERRELEDRVNAIYDGPGRIAMFGARTGRMTTGPQLDDRGSYRSRSDDQSNVPPIGRSYPPDPEVSDHEAWPLPNDTLLAAAFSDALPGLRLWHTAAMRGDQTGVELLQRFAAQRPELVMPFVNFLHAQRPAMPSRLQDRHERLVRRIFPNQPTPPPTPVHPNLSQVVATADLPDFNQSMTDAEIRTVLWEAWRLGSTEGTQLLHRFMRDQATATAVCRAFANMVRMIAPHQPVPQNTLYRLMNRALDLDGEFPWLGDQIGEPGPLSLPQISFEIGCLLSNAFDYRATATASLATVVTWPNSDAERLAVAALLHMASRAAPTNADLRHLARDAVADPPVILQAQIDAWLEIWRAALANPPASTPASRQTDLDSMIRRLWHEGDETNVATIAYEYITNVDTASGYIARVCTLVDWQDGIATTSPSDAFYRVLARALQLWPAGIVRLASEERATNEAWLIFWIGGIITHGWNYDARAIENASLWLERNPSQVAFYSALVALAEETCLAMSDVARIARFDQVRRLRVQLTPEQATIATHLKEEWSTIFNS